MTINFWGMVTVCFVTYFVTNLILQIIHKIIRARTIKRYGYPPTHCDGDGDAYPTKNEDL